MNRRNFLAFAAACALDPERLLWKPGAKLISIPKPALAVGDIPTILGVSGRFEIIRIVDPIIPWDYPHGLVMWDEVSKEEFESRYPAKYEPLKLFRFRRR